MSTINRATLAILLGVVAWGTGAFASAATITWKDIQWNIKSGTGMDPGLNNWSAGNVFVDANGDLHLALTRFGGAWYCAEISTDRIFGFGTFQWQVTSAVDDLDPNVVLGLFVYGPTALGPDGTHEIDIEYARFGSATADNGRWTIYPNVIASPPVLGRSSYALQLTANPATTSRFTWAPTSVAFATLGGFQAVGSPTNTIRSWTYQPADPGTTISQSPMPVHMNLWLSHGNPPTNGQGVEVVIHDFSFTPAVGPSAVPALRGDGAFLLAIGVIGVALLLLGRSSAAAITGSRRWRS